MSLITTLYPWNDTAAPADITKPGDFLGAWDQKSVHAGASAKRLSAAPEQGQKTKTKAWTAIPNTQTKSLGIVQYLSSPLWGQAQVTGNWLLAFSLRLPEATAQVVWSCLLWLSLVQSNGTNRTTIFNLAVVGATSRTGTGQVTCYNASLAGANFTPVENDYLCLEVGLTLTNDSGGDVTPTASEYSQGLTDISSDNAAASDAQARIVSPAGLYVKEEFGLLLGSPVPPESTLRDTSTRVGLLAPQAAGGVPVGRLSGLHEGHQKPGGN